MIILPQWWALRQLILEEEALCFSTTAFCLMSTCSTHYCLPPHMCSSYIKPLFCHLHTKLLPDTYFHQAFEAKNGKPIFPLFLFLLQTSRAAPDLTAVTTGLQECSTDGQRSTDWLQTTNHWSEIYAILNLILRCNSSVAVEVFPSERVILIYWPRSSKEN